MTRHTHYHEVTAATPREMGLALGRLFGAALRPFIAKLRVLPQAQRDYLARCYALTQEVFPDYAAEIGGYAEGAGIPPDMFWQMLLESDIDALAPEKCTSFVTNNGRLKILYS